MTINCLKNIINTKQKKENVRKELLFPPKPEGEELPLIAVYHVQVFILLFVLWSKLWLKRSLCTYCPNGKMKLSLCSFFAVSKSPAFALNDLVNNLQFKVM